MNRYSGLNTIPNGHASKDITPGCLVLEGGAFRGLYTQGFLDAMMEHNINMECVIGVSAGALSGMNYVAGQIGRSARINLGYRHDSRYIGLKSILHSGSLLDTGFLTEDRNIFEPLDNDRFMYPKQRFIAVATSLETGETAYFEKGKCSDIIKAVRASATMPYISRPIIIDNKPYFDGGCSCKIPYKWALDNNFKKILVVKTREFGHRREDKLDKLAYKFYKKYPKFAAVQAKSNFDANKQCDEIDKLFKQGRIYCVAPSKPVTVGRLEKDMEKLGDLYWLGYHDFESEYPKIKKYLEL